MNKEQYLNKLSAPKLLCTLFALGLACFIESSRDWVMSLSPPRLTAGAILLDAICLLIVVLILAVPITVLVWNNLISPVFEVNKIKYIHGLVIFTVFCWIGGL